MAAARRASAASNVLSWEGKDIRAVLFDLDGTLYRQTPMRALMAVELAALGFRRPTVAPAHWRALRAYRRAQEVLRETGGASASRQLEWAAHRAGIAQAELASLVDEWMVRRPLKYLRACLAPGLLHLLDLLERRGIPMGVFSDYPADAKLSALGLAGRFTVVLCAADPAVGAFKPDPRGFLVACDRLGAPPHEVLMVGDRADTDGAGARAAGMPCVIVGKDPFPNLERLCRAFDHGR